MRPRLPDGSWLAPFDPLSLTGWCEANAWQYTWYVPHDIRSLIGLMGGRGPFNRRLQSAFERAVAGTVLGREGQRTHVLVDRTQGSLLAMGLFDLRGGAAREPVYEITSPAFDRIAIRLDSRYYPGGEFVIETRHNSPQNMYIRDASLDGQPLGRPWLYHREIIRGGRLILELGNEPNRSWGSQPKQAPPSG